MSAQDYFILTAAQNTAAEGYNTPDVALGARAASNASPGVGFNLNPDASGVAAGASVSLTGKYVAPKRVVDDPEYKAGSPAMVTFLLTLPWAVLEAATIFAPAGGPS